jgi:hypothetical protein
MALLRNPSFEDGVAPWQPENIPNAVALQTFGGGLPRSGSFVLAAQTNTPGGSFRQDFPSNAPSVFAFAWVRAWMAPVAAQFTLWDGGNSISAFFTATQDWSFITNTIGLANPGQQRQVRFEFYIHTPFAFLLVDGANAF